MRHKLMQLMERGRARLLSAEIACNLAQDVRCITKNENQRRARVRKTGCRENGQAAERRAEVVPLMSSVAFVSVGQGHVGAPREPMATERDRKKATQGQ